MLTHFGRPLQVAVRPAVTKPNSITLASSELAPNMFGASSELVRSWFEAEIWPIIQLASSELARAGNFAAKFHYAS